MTHLVIFGQAGESLRHVAPERVTAATYEITDLTKAQDDATRILASGAAAVPGWTLTLDAGASPSQPDGAKIPVTTTAGPAIGDAAVVTSSDGASEGFTISAIEIDDYLAARSFLAGSYAIGSVVEGVTITATIPAALYDFEDALDDQRPLRVEWTYTINSRQRRVNEPIQLARQTLATASTGPAIELVRLGYPELGRNLLEGLTLEDLADYSLRVLTSDLTAHGTDVAALMLGGDQGLMLLVAKMIHEAATRGYAPGQRPLDDFLSGARANYTTRFEAVTTGRAGGQAIRLNTDAVSTERPDQTYRTPVGAM